MSVEIPVPERAPSTAQACSAVLQFAHTAAVEANWAAFHVGVPEGFAAYVYRYRDGDGGLLYVGMTSAARRRAEAHWQESDWWSWVMSAEYERCHDRDQAFKLETKIRREECPLFVRVHGYTAMIRELDQRYMVNHVTGQCYCNAPPDLTALASAFQAVVDNDQQDPFGWTYAKTPSLTSCNWASAMQTPGGGTALVM